MHMLNVQSASIDAIGRSENVALRVFGNGITDTSTPRRPERRAFPLLTYVCQFDGSRAYPTRETKKGKLKGDRAEQQQVM